MTSNMDIISWFTCVQFEIKKKYSEGYHMSDASDLEDPRRPGQHHAYPHVLGEAKADIYLSSSGIHIIKYTHMNTLKLMSPYQLHW